MAEKINVGKFINNLDSEDLSSEKLQGVVGNVYAKAIKDHKTTAKKAEDNLKDKDKETVEFTKSNHDRLKAHKNKPEKDLNKDGAPVEDKVVKEINESFSIKDFKKQWAEYKKSGSSDELEFGDWYYQFDVDFDKGTIFAGEPHKDIMGWSISRDFEIKLDPSVDIYGNISKLYDYIETKRRGVKESKKQRSPFRKVNESHDCKRNYKNVRFASQEIEKKGYSHQEANDIALKLFDDIEGDTQRSLEWHLEKILPKEEFDKEYPRNESLKEDTFAVRLKNDTADVRYEFVKATDEEDARRQLDKKFSKKGWKVTDIGVADPKATNPYDALKKESKSVAESKKTVGNKKLTEAKTFQPMTLREYGKKFLDGYLDTDVYDTEIDMGVAFVFDCDEEPTDNYEKFLSILADNVVVKDAFNDGDLTCDFSGFYKPYNDKINDWYKKNGGHQEFEGEEGYYDLVLATEGLVSGSYSEEDYKELCDIFTSKKNLVGESLIKESAEKIQPGNIYSVLVKELPAEDIDHHYSDLYVRKTPKSTEIVNRLTTKSLLSTFKDNIDGDIWYELPFCYTPFFGESKELTETPIPRNATKIKVGGKEFTKEKDWVDGNRVHVSPKDIKRFYGDDVEVLETDPNYKSKRTKEVKVLQGNYGYGWDDLVEYDKEDSAELKQDLRSYRENERNAQFRVITRRVPLGEEKLSEGAKPSELWYNKKEVLNNIWGLVCEGDDRLEDIRYIFESGLLKPNEFRYDRWGAKHSLIMGALRNGNYKAAELLKSLGEKILKSEVEEYKDLMARKVYSDETTRDALDEAKSSKKLIYTIGDRFVAHQLDGVTSPFNREFDAAKKYRDISNDPNFKHGSIGCKGKSYKAGVNQWVKDVEPTEFMVWTKKENPSWKDDVLDVYYRKETVNESKKLTEGKKIDLYVNGEYVCSSTRYKRVKDFVDAVKKDGKVTYAGLDNNGKLSDKVTKTIKDTDKVVGRIVTESKKLKEERRSRKALADESLDFEYTVRDAQGNVINGFSTKREAVKCAKNDSNAQWVEYEEFDKETGEPFFSEVVWGEKVEESLKEDLSKIQEEQTMKLVRLLGKGLITKQEFEQKLYGIIEPKLVRAPMFKDTKIKDFYTDNYPTDDLGEEINDTVTVQDVVDLLNDGRGDDFYSLIGVSDSVVRERVLAFIADACGVKYDVVYKKWLGEDLNKKSNQPITEARYNDMVFKGQHIASVDLYSTGCSEDDIKKREESGGHYEIDLDNKVFTKVQGNHFLGHYFIETYPRDTWKEVEQTAKNIMSGGGFREVSNDEYLDIQSKWENSKK